MMSQNVCVFLVEKVLQMSMYDRKKAVLKKK